MSQPSDLPLLNSFEPAFWYYVAVAECNGRRTILAEGVDIGFVLTRTIGAVSARYYRAHVGRPGWVEIDPQLWVEERRKTFRPCR